MPITFRCSDCTQKLRIEDDFAGKKVACVRCGSKQRVPLVSSPEFSQPSTPPASRKKDEKPAGREAAGREAKGGEQGEREPTGYEPSGRKPIHEAPAGREPSRREPIWFQPAEPADSEPAPIEPLPVQPAQRLTKPILPEWRAVQTPIPEPAPPEEVLPGPQQIFPEPQVAEPAAWEPDSPAVIPEPATAPAEIQPERTAAVSRQPRRAAAHAEPSLVPPYKKLDVEEMIDMTAMVDIVFFLLIFFLVTSMHALDSTIPMPVPDPQKGAAREPKSVAAIDSDDSYVVVRIDRNDRIMVEGSEVRTDRDLLFKLRDLRLGSAHPDKLLVVGHGDATHGTVVMVLDTGRELGMDQVRLTMQDEAD